MFKPLLAVACEDTSKIKYPVLVSSKKDGIRVTIHDGVVMSRSMKPIPSKAVQEKFGKQEFNGLDGELIYGDSYAENVFNLTTSFCMSHEVPGFMSVDNLTLYAFDRHDLDLGFVGRFSHVGEYVDGSIHTLEHRMVSSEEELLEFEKEELSKGAEGLMVRAVDGRYKQGRSTLKEGILLKIKRFCDEEALIIDFEEKMHNANEATVGELGQTKRSSHQENMIPCGTLGALVVHSEKWGSFKIGTGFNDAQRQEIWDNKDKYDGKLVKFKYFAVGIVDKPRFPVYIGIRHEDDM